MRKAIDWYQENKGQIQIMRNVRFFKQISINFYPLQSISKMNNILFLTLLVLATTAMAKQCDQGYLPIDGLCTKCNYIPGCAQYAQHGKCLLCEYGYNLFEGRCQYLQSPTNECCSLFDDDGHCIKCAPGLVLDRNSCFEIVRPGCLEGEGNVCTNCADDYNNLNGRCIRKIQYCDRINENGACAECNQGYILSLGVCIRAFEAPDVPDCAIKNEYGCVQCQQGFYLTKDRYCKAYQQGCLKYFQQQCLFCDSAYRLIQGKCLIEGCTSYGSKGCTECRAPYILSNHKCVIENCFESSNDACLICEQEFRLANGKCVRPTTDRCQGCSFGFIVGPNGSCIKQIPRCSQYGVSGYCEKCVGLFMLANGECIIPNCEEYGATGCKKCRSPFIQQQGFCGLRNCQIYNELWTECRVCQSSYHLEKSLCILNDPKCQNYEKVKTSSEVCTECYVGYILNEKNQCERKIPGCVYQYGKCISCSYPFKKVDNKCMIEGCATYTMNGCQTCESPFEAIRGNCVIPYCQEIAGGVCKRCESSYHIVLGRCYENDPKCSAYKEDVCVGCISGYIFVEGVCVRDIPHCKLLGRNECRECDFGYQLSYGGDCLTTDEKCLRFNSFGCEECRDGFHTTDGYCKVDDPNCLDYSGPSNTQICETCRRNYVFSSNGKSCIREEPGCVYYEGVCSSCKEPFTYNSKAKKCEIQGCLKYSETGCYSCQYPFENSSGKCIIRFCEQYDWIQGVCSTCRAGYRQIQGRCYREDPKCVQYNNKGECKLCITEHLVFDGICVKEDKNCEVYSKNGGCNKCKENYYNSPDNVCLPEKPGCIYQRGVCELCKHPFVFHQASQTCRIDGCLETTHDGCFSCRFPFEPNSKICEIPHCVTVKDNACARCTPGYHLKQGLYCVKDDPSCLRYNEDGDCEACARGYMLMSSGECELAEDNCVSQEKNGKCGACKPEYFLNRYYQCQKRDKNCEEYNNGVCSKCQNKYFLYDYICFPYTPGCVKYSGKDCVTCRNGWTMRNSECFKLKKQLLKIEGEDEHYDFEITPIDITKSKYYIDNLSPVSKLGKILFSSFYSKEYIRSDVGSDETGVAFSQGWKAEHERPGEYIGFVIEEGEPVTFYALQLESVEGFYVKQFYLEYSIDGTNFIRVEKVFDGSHSSKDLTTIYFTAIYAKAIRIVIKSYVGWPATKIQFFYYDYLRFRKISSLKSLRYLKESIQSNFVDRMDNQMEINRRLYFEPTRACSDHDQAICYTGLELCQARTINYLVVGCSSGWVSKVYVTYSIDGKSFNCFQKCREIEVKDEEGGNIVQLNSLLAKNVRVYPVAWQGDAEMRIEYDYD